MSNITPTTPNFVFGYWRPWKENSNLFDSYLNYARDTSLVKYGADTIGKYINYASKEQSQVINQASKEQVRAIEQANQKQVQAIYKLGEEIGRGINILSNQMSDINEELFFINRNMDIQIEQQKLSNLLLQNIAELLRVPDSEKERQHCIELGIKFFVNGSKDADLYVDALEELLKAETLMKQDYFVLHRIGCIYLYVEKYINPEKALEYFLRAAKYATVESDSKAARLASVLTNNFNTVNSDLNNSEKQIGLLAADSYEKAAFAAYVLGRFSDAVNYQSKSLKLDSNTKNRFILSKYQVRNGDINEGVKNLSRCIDNEPVFAIASFKEIDLINEPEVLALISNKNQEIDNAIRKLLDRWRKVESNETANVIKDLTELSKKSYEIKVSQFKLFEVKADKINNKIGATESEIDYYISKIKKTTLRTLDVNGVVEELTLAKDLPLEEMEKTFNRIIEQVKAAKDLDKKTGTAESEIDDYISEVNKTQFCTLDGNAIQLKIKELLKAKDLPIEKMIEVFNIIKKEVDADIIKIGSYYAGGFVFYIDKTGKHGLLCADKDFGKAVWGGDGEIGAKENGIGNRNGMRNTKKIVEHASWFIEKGFFSTTKTPAPTAARLCIESIYNSFSDWYLPTFKELELMYKTLKKKKIGNFQSAVYWSSTENGNVGAWGQNFDDGGQYYGSKNHSYYVRAVRAF